MLDKESGSTRFWHSVVAISSFTLSFLYNYFYSNSYSFLTTETILLTTISAVCLFVIFLIFHTLSLDWLFFSILIVLTLDFSTSFGNRMFLVLRRSGTPSFLSLATPYLVVITLVSTATYLVRRKIQLICATLFGIMLVSTLVGSIFTPHRLYTAKQIQPSDSPDHGRPNILFIILDENIGMDGIPPSLAEGNEARNEIQEIYFNLGFVIYPKAFSNFYKTTSSIPTFLNGKVKNRRFVLTGKDLFSKLAADGYRINVYQSSYLDFCDSTSDAFRKCFTYEENSIGYLKDGNIPATDKFFGLVDGFPYSYNTLLLKSFQRFILQNENYNPRLAAAATDRVLEELRNDMSRNKRGNLFFVHLLMPHYTYLFNCECQMNRRQNWENRYITKKGNEASAARERKYVLYLGQMRCLHKRLKVFFDSMSALGIYTDMDIIITGDHGSKIVINNRPETATHQDYVDLFSTFVAIKKGNYGSGALDQSKSSIAQKLSTARIIGEYFQLKTGDRPPDHVKKVHFLTKGRYVAKNMPDF